MPSTSREAISSPDRRSSTSILLARSSVGSGRLLPANSPLGGIRTCAHARRQLALGILKASQAVSPLTIAEVRNGGGGTVGLPLCNPDCSANHSGFRCTDLSTAPLSDTSERR